MSGVRVFVLVLAGCAVAAAFILPYAAAQLAQLGDVATDQFVQTAREAKAFAQTHTQSECVRAALVHAKLCDSMFCKPTGAMFAVTCLEHAVRSPELCREVPEPAFARWNWSKRQCSALGDSDSACQMVHEVLLEHCDSARSARQKTK